MQKQTATSRADDLPCPMAEKKLVRNSVADSVADSASVTVLEAWPSSGETSNLGAAK